MATNLDSQLNRRVIAPDCCKSEPAVELQTEMGYDNLRRIDRAIAGARRERHSLQRNGGGDKGQL